MVNIIFPLTLIIFCAIFSFLALLFFCKKIHDIFGEEEPPPPPPINYSGRLLDPLDNSNLLYPSEMEIIDYDSRKRFQMQINQNNKQIIKKDGANNLWRFEKWNKRLKSEALYMMNFGNGLKLYNIKDIEENFSFFFSTSLTIPNEYDEALSRLASGPKEELKLINNAENIKIDDPEIERLKKELENIAGKNIVDLEVIKKIIQDNSKLHPQEDTEINPEDMEMIKRAIAKGIKNLEAKKHQTDDKNKPKDEKK
ncbi:hypothetical protein A2331_06530 [Candidatus Falkowbacteria bacterium RIFOXYB2_FULL_34_18]|uniref:Uncharacterized protein n=1 Tax=Candidatus Falkowbacteria bacterium RIFOXYD2_FULL_34_120 TaxID=1798007 RepID=A0A1F5TRE9_9BACT|nr:MAG: hypothetical protein A2331_06530 [Candidatus Falkowbacteria bacterium RIFOXYB2_FULL_34_18]OGF36638.1 MAG: hypothetical protein A2466_03450 [Candidatus Falkowbacteria bacterium RIFOXYC2_FULL_34_220]OGF39291.1 MAG: hypothetical protein A2515_01915 [Candidatus Falkowbacteria bacterium RIFOXYD12_FULL_34_57]OGF41429.1 MAG: hypothetical protein A2531_00080 [Candidatus Falkowbacteria bacterium RIFOXYD2_FULL_34_120]